MRSKWALVSCAVGAVAFAVALAAVGASWASVVLGALFALCVLLGAWSLWVTYVAERTPEKRDNGTSERRM